MSLYVELTVAPGTWQRFRSWPARRTLATAYGTFVAALVATVYLCSVFGVLPYDPEAMDLAAVNALPSAAHPLGTDFVGRDLLARIMLGTEAFFLPGLLSVGVSLLAGALFGVLAGFWPERFATPIGILLQALESLPKLVLVLLVIALFRPDIYLILLVVGVTNIPAAAELLRARIAVLRRKSYIEAALALGLHPARVILKHVLWLHGRGLVLVLASIGMGEAILIETAPAAAILLTVLGFHLLGDAVLERLEEGDA
jgi:peptide/nickel transport system permease protein